MLLKVCRYKALKSRVQWTKFLYFISLGVGFHDSFCNWRSKHFILLQKCTPVLLRGNTKYRYCLGVDVGWDFLEEYYQFVDGFDRTNPIWFQTCHCLLHCLASGSSCWWKASDHSSSCCKWSRQADHPFFYIFNCHTNLNRSWRCCQLAGLQHKEIQL